MVHMPHYLDGKTDRELIGCIGFGEQVEVDKSLKRKILVTGAGSYIGQSFINYAKENYHESFEIDELDMLDDGWQKKDFSKYDIVYHVAGIAHADVGNVTDEVKERYYRVNTDLAIRVAKKAKAEGIKGFVFMSSMIVYGDSAPYGKQKIIDENTVPIPANFYGDSKLQADVAVRELADDNFKVIVLRPPMIYGRGSKGNYHMLAKLARKLPVFPDVDNKRSMLYIDNLCEFLSQIMLIKHITRNSIVLLPQNAEWTKTSEMVKEIARVCGKRIVVTKIMRAAVAIGSKVPGRMGSLVNKAFGNSCYAHELSVYKEISYQKYNLLESIHLTESDCFKENDFQKQKSVLMIASVASMIDQFNMSNIEILLKLGYKVDVACNFVQGNTCSVERIEALKQRLSKMGVSWYQIDFTRNVMNLNKDFKSYFQVKKLVQDKHYAFMHCHSPIGGVIGRIAGHKLGVKEVYTAHGFHFYDGAPLKNWLIYYPIEKLLSRWTDILITINKEDYYRAKKQFKAKNTEYIPGIGIDISKFSHLLDADEIEKKKEKLGIREKTVFLSVGELNTNKNHESVIRAIGKIPCKNELVYLIAGKGGLSERLRKIAKECGVSLLLLGFREDMPEIYSITDVYIHPSFREGMSVATLEAIASKRIVIASEIRGEVDVLEPCCLFDPCDIESISNKIRESIDGGLAETVLKNYEALAPYSEEQIKAKMHKIYGSFL